MSLCSGRYRHESIRVAAQSMYTVTDSSRSILPSCAVQWKVYGHRLKAEHSAMIRCGQSDMKVYEDMANSSLLGMLTATKLQYL